MGTLSRSLSGNFLSEAADPCCTVCIALAVSPRVCSTLACRGSSNSYTSPYHKAWFTHSLYCEGESDSILPIVEKARVLCEEMLCHISSA